MVPEPMADIRRELREMQLLFDIARTLNERLSLGETADLVLRRLADRMGLVRGTITILDRASGEIEIDQAFGLSAEEQARGRYRLGEGVTGRVVATGQPARIARVSQDPLFLDRTRTRNRARTQQNSEISFICVPLSLHGEVIGALSVDRPFVDEASLAEDERLLTIVASLITRAVDLRRQARARERQVCEENERLQRENLARFRPMRMVGNSHAIQQVFCLVNQVSASSATVLLRGESGVGKELVAESIHFNSPRADKPFIKVNLTAIPETLIESELFGHERGAFTGASAARIGRFEAADGGTLFLDEIGDLPMLTQIKLLRVLQDHTFERLGGNKPLHSDVRVITATNRDLEKLITAGTFRADLYYRLNVFPIVVPPLRAGRTDIPMLADYFVERAAQRHGKSVRRISTPAIDMLMSYHWPGNVRELENAIERAVLLSADGVVHGHHLPPTLQTAEASQTPPQGMLDAALAALEREMLVDALKAHHGNMAAAARRLGISERLIGLRVRKYAIHPERFAGPP